MPEYIAEDKFISHSQKIEKRVHNKTSLALQNLVDTEGHDTVGSFGLSLSSYRGV